MTAEDKPAEPEAIKFTDLTAWFFRHIPELQTIQGALSKMAADFPRDAVTVPGDILNNYSKAAYNSPQFLKARSAFEESDQYKALAAAVEALPDGELQEADLAPYQSQALWHGQRPEAARFDGSRIKALLDLVKTLWPIIQMFFPDLPTLPTV